MLAAVILSGGASHAGAPQRLFFPTRAARSSSTCSTSPVTPKITRAPRRLGVHANPSPRPSYLAANEVVINADWQKGQLSSIQAALKSLPADFEGMLLCLVDHPLISANLVGDLIDAFYSSNAAYRSAGL